MKLCNYINGKKEFRLGFLGGSITEGACASSPDKRYATLVTKALSGKYPETDIVEINAGIGGTGSSLGIFRMERDVLSKEPDMLFVEFAVNDFGFADTGIYMENIIRNAKKYKEDMPICFIFTIEEAMLEIYEKGEVPDNIQKLTRLCEYYSVPFIDVGYTLFKNFGKSIKEFTSHYFHDNCHPIDVGYARYADLILEFLETAEFCEFDGSLPYLFGKAITNPALLLAEDFVDGGFKVSEESLLGRLPNYIYSDNIGDEITLEFDGSVFGIFYMLANDNGSIDYCFDGGEWNNLILWNNYAPLGRMAHWMILNDKLDEGHHFVKIRVSETKADAAEGRFVRIGAFLVG